MIASGVTLTLPLPQKTWELLVVIWRIRCKARRKRTMAQYRAIIKGNRGEASRLGSKSSGLEARVNGWDVGVYVEVHHIEGKDRILIYSTGGSNAPEKNRPIAIIIEPENFQKRPIIQFHNNIGSG